ncbi:MAG: hypothetical protein QOE97_1033, partial [Pseudonocardiales bacterium]|nr:hypothetical protein [Pseudonocardiales bacterium]
PADRTGMTYLDPRDRAPGDPALHALPDGLDLGQLRHGGAL